MLPEPVHFGILRCSSELNPPQGVPFWRVEYPGTNGADNLHLLWKINVQLWLISLQRSKPQMTQRTTLGIMERYQSAKQIDQMKTETYHKLADLMTLSHGRSAVPIHAAH